jgi:hypothetical protein
MSAENVVNTPIVEVAADAVKQKKPTLAGKYSKLLNFGYWFASIIDNEEMKAQMHTQLRLFGTIEEQTELFERFFAEEKDTAKAIRKCIADHNKPPKPVKTKAAKATRKGKAEVHQDELISQLLADANAVVDEPVPAKVDKEAAKLAKEQAKEAAKLAKEQEKADAIRAKEAEKEAAKLAKEQEKADAIRAKEQEKEAAKLAKEQEKADKEMAKLAKKVELEAKAATKLAKEQEKASKPEKKKATKTSAIAPVAEVVAEPVVLETVVAEPIVEKVMEVPENTAQVTQELVAEVIEEPAAAPAVSTKEPEPLAVPAASTTEAPKEKSKKTKETKQKPAKEPKEPKETKKKAEKKPKAETPKPVEEEEEIQTRVANIAGNDYLIDQDFNVYAMEEPHDHIGVYNQETGAIDAL